MSRPWMPMYWGDYLRDTQHLNTIEHGAYLLLIGHYWNHGSLPTDHASLKAIAKLHGRDGENSWRSICLAIAPFFDENWRHKRIDAELEKANIISAKRAYAGFRGGSASRVKTNAQRFAVEAFAKQTGGQPQSKIYSSTNSDSEIGTGQAVETAGAASSLATAPWGALARPPLSEREKKEVGEKSKLAVSPYLQRVMQAKMRRANGASET